MKPSRQPLSPPGTPPNTLFVPDFARSEVLQWGHSSRLACHPGLSRTLNLLWQCFLWPFMTRDTRSFTAACPVCVQVCSAHSRFLTVRGHTLPRIL